jgi:hypothetical protein
MSSAIVFNYLLNYGHNDLRIEALAEVSNGILPRNGFATTINIHQIPQNHDKIAPGISF